LDETKLKPFCPFNIILATQFGKKAGRNISTCENPNLGFLGVSFKGKSPNFGSRKLEFPKVFLSSNVNVLISLLDYSFQVIPPKS
jgi:hypothetical protein